MQKGHLEGQKNFGSKKVTVNVSVILFEEDDTFYAYLPSMDLTGYGKTQKEANESLTLVLDEFLRYTLNKNTFSFELQRLGWKVKSKSKPMMAPAMSDLINMNDQLKEIVNHKQFTTSNYQVDVPAFA
jgi:hypothetical protein